MISLLEIGLSNAVVATLLAAVALLVGKYWRRPALVHALWLLVLLKLVTPLPLVPVEVVHLPVAEAAADPPPATREPAWPAWPLLPPMTDMPVTDAEGADAEKQNLIRVVQTVEGQLAVETAAGTQQVVELPDFEPEPVAVPAATAEPEPYYLGMIPAADSTAEGPRSWGLPGWAWLLAGTWAAGTLAYLLLAVFRVRHFGRLLDYARPAPAEIRDRVRRLAKRVGLRNVPEVWLAPGPITPMVWGALGRNHLMLPSQLLRRLSKQQQATLLTHELAHLRRRDHWLRWIELLVTALYWWHPVVWLARYQIREAEEQCCDAWVVWALPQAVKDYLSAVLETVDFLAADPLPVPAGGSGVGQFNHLQRRFSLVVHGRHARRLSGRWKAGLLLAAVALLPLLPTVAQEAPDATDAAVEEPWSGEGVTAGAVLQFEARPRALQHEAGRMAAVVIAPDGTWMATGSGFSKEAGALVVWDLATRQERFAVSETQGVRSVAVSPDSRLVAAGTFNSTIQIVDANSGEVLHTLYGHSSAVNSVDFSSDGKLLASGSLDRTVRLWNVETGELLRTLNGHTNRVFSVDFSPDGKLIASGGLDNTARVWDVESGEAKHTLQGHTQAVECVRFAPDGTLATGSWDQTIKLWDVQTGKPLQTLAGHQSNVMCIDFTRDGQRMASGDSAGQLKLWATDAWRETASAAAHGNQLYGVAFFPDGKTLATASWDKTVKLWDVTTLQEKGVFVRQMGPDGGPQVVFSVAYSPDGKQLATALEDTSVRLLDAATGKVVGVLRGHRDVVACVCYSPDGRTLATTSYDKTVKLWDTASGELKATLEGHTNWVFTAVFSPDGATLASGGYDKTIRLWDVEGAKPLATLEGHAAAVRSLAFYEGGKRLVSGSSDRTLGLWDTESRQRLATLRGHKGTVRAVAVGRNMLASGSEDGTVRTWDLDSDGDGARPRATLSGHTDAVAAVAFAPGGGTLASGGFDNTVRTWNANDGTALQTLQGHGDLVSSVVFSPNGLTLASASFDKRVNLWTASRPAVPPLATFVPHEDEVRPVAFSPDGQQFVTGGRDLTARLWDRSGRLLRVLEGHRSTITAAEFSPDGKWLATGSYDATVRLWDLTSEQPPRVLPGNPGQSYSLAFSPDGKLLASGGANKVVKIWSIPGGELKQSLPAQSMFVTSVAFSAEGLLATSTGNWKEWRTPGELTIWDPTTGAEVGKFAGHTAEIKRMAVSRDGKLLATAGSDRVARVFDFASGALRATLQHDAAVTALAFLPDGRTLATGSNKGKIALWSLPTRRVQARMAGHAKRVAWLAASPDGELLVSTAPDGTVKTWPLVRDAAALADRWGAQWERHHGLKFDGESNYVHVAGLRYDGSHPITIEAVANTAKIKNATLVADYEAAGVGLHLYNGKWMFNVRDGDNYRVAASDTDAVVGKTMHLAGVYDGRMIKLYVDGKLQQRTDAMQGEFRASGLPFYVGANPAPNGRMNEGHAFEGRIDAVRISGRAAYDEDFSPPAALPRDEDTLLLYHLAEGSGTQVRDASGHGHHGSISGATWVNPRSGPPVELTADRTIEVSDVDVQSLAYSPDGRYLVASGRQGAVHVYDATTYELSRKLEGHASQVSWAAFTADGRRLATASWDQTVRIWNFATGEAEGTLTGHSKGVRFVCFSSDGKRVATASSDGLAIVWDAESFQPLQKFQHGDLEVYCARLSPDGKLLATSCGNWPKKLEGPVRLWDVESGKELGELQRSQGMSTGIVFTAGGSRLLVTNAPRGLASWDAATRRRDGVLIRSANIRNVAVSADGRWIAACEGAAREKAFRVLLWDSQTGRLAAVMPGHTELIFSVRFSPRGDTLASSSRDGTIRIWKLPAADKAIAKR